MCSHKIDLDKCREAESHLRELESCSMLRKENENLQTMLLQQEERVKLLESMLVSASKMTNMPSAMGNILRRAGITA